MRDLPIAPQDVVLSFGKHKDKQIKHVNDGYLRWMQASLESSSWREMASQDLQGRKKLVIDELQMCSLSRNVERGKEIHGTAMENGDNSCNYLASALVKMYVKCGKMDDARQVFDFMTHPDVALWNVLILGYAENGKGITALDLFDKMKSQGWTPNSFTFVAAVKACTSLVQDQNGKAECLERGKEIHLQIGCHLNVYVQTALIKMYATCGSMVDARRVFDSIKQPNVVTWNTLILGYADNGEGVSALDMFAKMKSEGCEPTSFTFVAVLQACTFIAESGGECLERGKEIHSQIDCHSDRHVQNTLINMYSKCGSMVDARQVFNGMVQPDVLSWTALILGYADNGEYVPALDLFANMRSQGCAPNHITFAAVLKACTCLALGQNGSGRLECLEQGKRIHSQIGRSLDMYVQNSLIDMYAKCSSMIDARRVFDAIKHPNIVSWNTLISGYVYNGEDVTALDLFARMKSQGYAPNGITFNAVLKACSSLGALESGSKIHAEINKGTELNVILVTSLVDLYVKCGSLDEAKKVFDLHPTMRDLKTWTALLGGYSRLGDDETVFKLFEGLQEEGFRPNGITLLCVLMCCSHAGLVDKGKEFFETISTKYGINHMVEHYNCMVDILGRSNMLEDAIALLRNIPCRPNGVTWMTVLGTCHERKNVGLGRLAFESCVDLDDDNAAVYVLMAHIYGSRGMWKEQEIVLAMRK